MLRSMWNLPRPGMEPECPALAGRFLSSGPLGKSWVVTSLSPEVLQLHAPLLDPLLEGESESHSVVSNSLRPHGLYSPWSSPGQNTGVGILSLLQGIFPTQGSNPGLPHCRRIFYQLNHKESQRILEWVAYPFSSGSS